MFVGGFEFFKIKTKIFYVSCVEQYFAPPSPRPPPLYLCYSFHPVAGINSLSIFQIVSLFVYYVVLKIKRGTCMLTNEKKMYVSCTTICFFLFLSTTSPRPPSMKRYENCFNLSLAAFRFQIQNVLLRSIDDEHRRQFLNPK